MPPNDWAEDIYGILNLNRRGARHLPSLKSAL